MAKNGRKFLVMILALQLVAAPMLQASIMQNHTPLEEGSRVGTTELAVEVVTKVVTTDQSGPHSHENHDQCDEINGTVDRCASCFCISVALLSQEFKTKELLDQTVLAKVPKFNLYHIYPVPPLRPPIS